MREVQHIPRPKRGYEQDFFAWTQEQAESLRERRLGVLDLEHLAEEIESLGKRDRREVLSRCQVLLVHLLKWAYQPDRRGSSWRQTIAGQRDALEALLEDSPSLRPYLEGQWETVYSKAVRDATRETDGAVPFPKACPWTLHDVLEDEFLPD